MDRRRIYKNQRESKANLPIRGMGMSLPIRDYAKID